MQKIGEYLNKQNTENKEDGMKNNDQNPDIKDAETSNPNS